MSNYGDSLPFCACGRRLTECDGSRTGCRALAHRKAGVLPDEAELYAVRAERDAARAERKHLRHELERLRLTGLTAADPTDRGASVGGRPGLDPAGLSVDALRRDEVDLGAVRSARDDADRVLRQLASDRAGGAARLLCEVLTRALLVGEIEQVDDHAGLAIALPEAARAGVRRSLEALGNQLFDALAQAFGIDGDAAPGLRQLADPPANQQPDLTRRLEVAQDVASKSASAPSSGHVASVAETQDMLNERIGRWPNRHWIMIEPIPRGGGYRVTTSWLPASAGHFPRGSDGGLNIVCEPRSLPQLLHTIARLQLEANRDL